MVVSLSLSLKVRKTCPKVIGIYHRNPNPLRFKKCKAKTLIKCRFIIFYAINRLHETCRILFSMLKGLISLGAFKNKTFNRNFNKENDDKFKKFKLM